MAIKLELELDVDRALLVLAYIQQLNDGKVKPVTAAASAPQEIAQSVSTTARTRKGRADAGQSRGRYKPRGRPDGTALGSVLTVPPEGVVAEQPTPIAVSPKAAAPAQEQRIDKAQESSTPVAAAPTLDDAKKALHALNDVAGKGMDACLRVLQKFGVMRVSDMQPAIYSNFIAACKTEAETK